MPRHFYRHCKPHFRSLCSFIRFKKAYLREASPYIRHIPVEFTFSNNEKCNFEFLPGTERDDLSERLSRHYGVNVIFRGPNKTTEYEES